MYRGNLTATNHAQRTSQSCEHCHRRKVRCDLNSSGASCTNCRLDGRQCERRVPLKRGRKSFLNRAPRQNVVQLPDTGHRHSTQSPAVDTLQEDASQTSPLDSGSREQDSSSTDLPIDPLIFVPFYYHRYLQRLDISHLSPVQVQLLEEQGCFKVPSGSVLREFVRHYFLYVHPCLPILNEAAFWSMYQEQGISNQSHDRGFSLALFQAMLFAASRFVSLQVIEACGFQNLKDARTSFNRRSELLLLNEVEKDTIALAQTSLLLSLHSTINEQSLNSVWLTKSVQYAKHVGAHRYYCFAQEETTRLLEKKKLWWSCIIRDRMIAIGVRRNVQITSADFDFDQAKLVDKDFAEEQEQSQVYNATTKKVLNRIIKAQYELAVAQTPTVTAAYGQGVPLEEFSIAQLVVAMTEIERAKTELAIWARRFKTELFKFSDDNQENNGTHSSVTLFADMALIHYDSTLVALSNHEILVLERYQVQLDDYSSRLFLASTQLSSSIANVANRVKGLNDQGLAHHLPISAPACTALPFVLKAIDLRLSTASQRSAHQRQIEYYSKIMGTFRAQHDHTECVTTAVDNILRVVEPELRQMLTTAESIQNSISATGPCSTVTTFSRPSSWSDMLINNPLLYLRLYLFLDRSLSLGMAPSMSSLPLWILGMAAELQPPVVLSSPHHVPSLIHQPRFIELDDGDDRDVAAAQCKNPYTHPLLMKSSMVTIPRA
ncbi:hypothetical protein IQ07DRAFT_146497 [Pyrenochaeta sp. DS3sAY3a]|nr:hypothetical protein IQ07DRAFT_146497 [Pyrenochaeta sp. DS3sAY3a]